MNPRPWLPWSVDSLEWGASGRIEVRFSLDGVLYSGTALIGHPGGKREWRIDGASNKFEDRVIIPDGAEWRFLGPPIPPPETQGQAIIVWTFGEAPGELEAMSGNGGDEDWIALLPATKRDDWIPWLDSDSFGCSGRAAYDLEDGRQIIIGSHA